MKPKIFESAIVEKRNFLNELRTTLHSPQELRLFSIYLSAINPYNINSRIVRFPLSEFQRIMGFGRLNIAQLKASAEHILEQKVFVPKESGGFKGVNLFECFDVDKDNNGEWYVEISASTAALPLMFEFKSNYFKYRLWNALLLKSANQIRMYEILKQYEHIGKREIAVDELQKLLNVNYSRWDKFKEKVLDSCQKALQETTDISYTYEKGKSGIGGKWLTIVFWISHNKPKNERALKLIDEIELTLHSEYTKPEPTMNEPELERLVDYAEQNNIDIKLSDLKEIYYTMQDKGYSDILAAFKRIYQKAVNNDPADLKKYIISIIKNDTPLNPDESAPDSDIEKYKVLINKF